MDRVTLRVPEQQVEEVERLVDEGEFPSRSEAIRTGIRELIRERRGDRDELELSPLGRAD